MGTEFLLLGPLAVRADGAVPIHADKHRAVLAACCSRRATGSSPSDWQAALFAGCQDGRVGDLMSERYISITTFRRDGSPVATPVWMVADSGLLYVWTGAQTGKAKRIRHTPAVTVAPCTARGTPTGSAVPAQALVVPLASRPRIWPLFLAKYGIQLRAVLWSARITGLLRRNRPPSERVFLELTLTDS